MTTLAAFTIAIVQHQEWSDDERWLLGLSVGVTLLGILVIRICGRRVWLAGVLSGTLGSLIAICILMQQWLSKLNEEFADGFIDAEELAENQREYITVAIVTLVIGELFSLLAVCAFKFGSWMLQNGESGMLCTVRKHPYRTATVIAIAVSLVLAIVNIDFLVAPQALYPAQRIALPPLERPMVSRHGVAPVRTGSLSRNGEFLIVHSFVAGFVGPTLGEVDLYHLDPQPRKIPLNVSMSDRAYSLTFDPEKDRLAYLEWEGEYVYNKPAETHRIHILDLTTLEDTELAERPRLVAENLHWQPGGKLVLSYDKQDGHTLLTEHDGQWSRAESSAEYAWGPNSGMSLQQNDGGMRLVDLDSSREIEVFSKSWVEQTMKAHPSHCLLSPDARFIMADSRIYDRQADNVLDLNPDNDLISPHFHGFSGNTAVSYDYRWKSMSWPWPSTVVLYDTPFVAKAIECWEREPIRFLDPLTGKQLARTSPLDSSPDVVTFSTDGSRMAVFNDEGVYVFDIPLRFRVNTNHQLFP